MITDGLPNLINPGQLLSSPKSHSNSLSKELTSTGKSGNHLNNNALIITAGKIISEKNGIIRKLQINIKR